MFRAERSASIVAWWAVPHSVSHEGLRATSVIPWMPVPNQIARPWLDKYRCHREGARRKGEVYDGAFFFRPNRLSRRCPKLLQVLVVPLVVLGVRPCVTWSSPAPCEDGWRRRNLVCIARALQATGFQPLLTRGQVFSDKLGGELNAERCCAVWPLLFFSKPMSG